MSFIPRSVPESSQAKTGDAPAKRKPAASVQSARICPVCSHPQTKIQRQLNGEKHGSVNYVCARADVCPVGINLTKVDTWVAV